ncbi:hypothetical protein GDO81_026331 [Engystomops pustulosus]|uniref:B30.2/SPRY domain-containing protein n=1 Tax=Engystomops pustulosus TaxID=76066 RepID=A0AAV6ZSB6_ENGPU|nr:hypothetical protein GDO81_026331 [Engystomops pustulosus]
MDSTCICVSCCVAGDHKGHEVEILDVASEKKKETLKPVSDKLSSRREEAEGRIKNLKEHETKEKEKSSGLAERVSGLFTDLRGKMDDLEKGVLSEIYRQEKQVSLSVSDMVKEVELHKDELTKKRNQLQGLCDITDPLAFLQESVIRGDIINQSCDVIGDVREAQSLDDVVVSQMLHRGLLRFADDLIDLKIKRQFPVMEKSENRPDGPKRFKSCQVFSSCSFSSGRHYWEVDVSQAKEWIIGVAGDSLERKVVGNKSFIGFNEKSWGLMVVNSLGVLHNNILRSLKSESPVKAVGIYLDYEAGRLSFYQLCDPIRHLHTFTASFTEPLYAAFYLYENCILRIMI